MASHLQKISYFHYLSTGNFIDAIFTNWQAAVLQLTCLVLFGEILHQKGASHSREPEHDPAAKGERDETKRTPWIYRHSLSAALFLLFVGALLAHLATGTAAYNEIRAMSQEAPVSIATYFVSGAFWFKVTQTWQGEFFGIAIFIVLSIFLREEHSAESKPVTSSNRQTGGTNE